MTLSCCALTGVRSVLQGCANSVPATTACELSTAPRSPVQTRPYSVRSVLPVRRRASLAGQQLGASVESVNRGLLERRLTFIAVVGLATPCGFARRAIR